MTATVTELARRKVELARNEFLLLDAKDGMLRGSYWRLRRPGENGPGAPVAIVDQLHAEGVLPAGGKKAADAWIRAACQRDRLEDLLLVLFQGSPSLAADPRLVEEYVRMTGWGAELP